MFVCVRTCFRSWLGGFVDRGCSARDDIADMAADNGTAH